jgi:anaerobic ribonucleoside-triphosphate reductase activating protein
MRLAGVSTESIVDGLGIRYVIFTQGCKHNCKGCQNPTTHDFNGGQEIRIGDLVADIISIGSIDGITLSGGDPMYQAEECCKLIDTLHKLKPKLDVWCYTGYTIEELVELRDKSINSLLGKIDVLVDGRFEQDKITLNKPFRGSTNQRIIDLHKSRIADMQNLVITELVV